MGVCLYAASQTQPLHAGNKSRGQTKMPKQRPRFTFRGRVGVTEGRRARGGRRAGGGQCNHGTLSDRILICDNWRILALPSFFAPLENKLQACSA